ncbi:hypothetical protein AHF37_09337 [Paragonimus kellicotti]|nr:hypothetical protein AHF37_09337 [Paragonimus kellicotti]
MWKPLVFPKQAYSDEDEEQFQWFRLLLKYADIPLSNSITDSEAANSRFLLGLYVIDTKSMEVMHRCSFSGNLKIVKLGEELLRGTLNETFYICIPAGQKDSSCIVSLVAEENSRSWELGWASIDFSDISILATDIRPFIPGSMRAMFLLGKNFDQTLRPPNENFCMHYKLDHYSSLDKCVHLLPENKIILASQRIPGTDLKGVLTGDAAERFRKIYLEDIRISMKFSELSKFEEELCQTILTDSSIRANRSRSTTPGSLIVIERRLKIFYHNRFKVIEPIPVVYLDLYSTSPMAINRSRPRKSLKNARLPLNLDIKNVSSEEFCLTARNPAQLFSFRDPEVAIVFVLEYVLGETTSARRDSNSDLVRQVNTAFTVRWGSYTLFTNPEVLDKEECVVKIHVPLQGTPDKFVAANETEVNNNQPPLYNFDVYEKQLCCTFCPDGTLCFRDETKSAIKFTLSGTVSIGHRPQIIQNEILINTTQSVSQSEAPVPTNQMFPVCQEARR